MDQMNPAGHQTDISVSHVHMGNSPLGLQS